MTDQVSPTLRSADRMLHKLEASTNILVGILIFALMIYGCYGVLMREVMSLPTRGYIEYVEISLPVVALLAISHAHRQGVLVRMDLVLRLFGKRGHWAIEFLFNLLIAIVAVALLWGSWRLFSTALEFGDTTIDARLFTWPSKLLVSVGYGLLLCRCCIAFFGYLRLLRSPFANPVGVPQRETDETLVKSEAQ